MKDWGFVAAITLARMAFGFQFQTIASMGPELAARFHLEFAALGTLIGLYMLPGIVVSMPGGMLGRRFGPRWLVGGGLALMCAGGLLGAVQFSPAGIGVGRIVAGTGAVMLVVMQGKMISDRFGGPRFMPVMGLLVGAFPVGVGLVGLVQDPLIAVAGPVAILLAGAGIALLSLLLFLLTVEDPPAPAGHWTLPSRAECVLVVVAGLVWTAYNSGYYGFLSYMPSLLAHEGHSPALAATVLTVATWTNLPATILGGIMATRWGTTPVLLLGTLGSVVSVAGPAFADWPLIWGVLFGALGSIHAGVIIGIGTLSARPENRASAMGVFYTTYYLGGTVLPGVFGWAADRAGSPAGALLTAAGVAALTMPVYLLHQWLQRGPARVTAPRPGTGTQPGS